MKKIISFVLMVCTASAFGAGFIFHNNSSNTVSFTWTYVSHWYNTEGVDSYDFTVGPVDEVWPGGSAGLAGGDLTDHGWLGGTRPNSAHIEDIGTLVSHTPGLGSRPLDYMWYPGDPTITVELYPAPPPPCQTNLVFKFRNADPVTHHYYIHKYSLVGGIDLSLNLYPVDVPGGGDMTYTIQVQCDDVSAYSVVRGDVSSLNSDGGLNTNFIPVMTANGGFPPGGSPPSMPSGLNLPGNASSSGVQFDGSNTNSNQIIWSNSGSDTAAVVAAVKDGTKALFDSSAKVAIQAHSDALAGDTLLTGILNKTNSDVPFFSSSTNVWVQNFPTNQPFPLSTFVGIYNLLSSQDNFASLSNYLGTLNGGSNSNLQSTILDISNILVNVDIYGRSNSDSVVYYMSNILSNLADSTNVDIATEITQIGVSNLLGGILGVLTNGVSLGTNGSGGMTNYALESTQEGISNILGMADSGGDGLSNALVELDAALSDTNGLGTNGFVAFGGDTNGYTVELLGPTNAGMAADQSLNSDATYKTAETSFKTFINSAVGPTVDTDFGDADMTVDFGSIIGSHVSSKVSGGGGMTYDFNPLHNARVAPLFPIMKSIFTWGLAVAYMLACAKDSVKAAELLMLGRGVNGPPPVSKKLTPVA